MTNIGYTSSTYSQPESTRNETERNMKPLLLFFRMRRRRQTEWAEMLLACLLACLEVSHGPRTRTIPPRRSFDYTFRLPRDTAVRLEHGLGWFWNLKNFKVLRCCWSSRLYIVHGTRQHFSWFSPYNPKTTLINGWVESANNFLFRIVCHVFPLFSIHRWRYKRGMCV